MDHLIKLPFTEQLTYGITSKRKVFSGFGLGVGSSLLILSLIFLYCPVKISLFNPVFQGFTSGNSSSSSSSWPFSFSSSSNSSLELVKNNEQSVQEKNSSANQGSLFNGSINANGSDFNGGKMGTLKTQDGNFTEGSQNARSNVTDFNGGKMGTSKTHDGNFTEGSQNGSSVVLNGTHEGNFTEQIKNGSVLSEGGGVGEKTQMGSLAADVKNASFSGKKQPSDDKSTEAKSSEVEKKEGFVGSEKGGLEKTQGDIQKGNFNETEKIASSYNESGVVKGNVTEKDKIGSSNNESAGSLKDLPDLSEKCDIFRGGWVKDDKKPYYPAGSCPHIDRDFDCHLNGRPDDDFLRWRWQPNECNIPSLNATDFLERLRGKRLIFVGDSLNRNMWESLVCMLRHGVKNKSRVHERSGRSHFKVQGFYSFRYEDYNCSVEFVSAPFLVRESSAKHQNGTVETLRLDLMDKTTAAYRAADVIVFNTGHWWTHEKTSKGENYYQEGTHVYPKLKVLEAFKKALFTWAKWVDKNIDTNRTQVFFRGYSVTHFRGGQWNSGGQCHKETEPIFNETYLAKYPSKMKVLENVLQQMKTPIVYLNISKLTDYRKDGHPSIYRMEYKTEAERIAAVSAQDCSHWCLPGVPDTWNELLYATLLKIGRGTWKR